jgi:CheY-like chemotaxis protein
VLVVEDDFDSAEIICILVQQAGHDCRVALNATEARAITEDFVPDVVLIDIGLPGEDGYQLVRTLKDQPALLGCHFVALTGYIGSDLPQQSVDAGFEAHLTKPVSLDLLLGVLDHCAAGPGDLKAAPA